MRRPRVRKPSGKVSVVLAIVILAVLAAGGTYAGLGGRFPGQAPNRAGATSPPSTPASTVPGADRRPAVLAALHPPSTAPTRRAVTRWLKTVAGSPALGPKLDGEAVDLDTGRVLWTDHPTTAAAPASTAKLLTSTAALLTLGDNAHLTTSIRRKAKTIWLVGGGDVTLANSAAPAGTYPVPASLQTLADQTASRLKADHIHEVRLRLDTSAEFGPRLAPGWKPSYFGEGDLTPPSALEVDEGRLATDSDARTLEPAEQAELDFVEDLGDDHIAVATKVSNGTAPPTATTIAAVQSPTIAALVQELLTVSDNDLAETLGRAVARKLGNPPTFAGEARSVLSVDRRAGVDLSGVRLVDASGLSHHDRVTPDTLISVLKLAAANRDPAAEQALAPILEGLPIAGFTGTLSLRYATPQSRAGAGVVRAKTGTLDGVNSLAGITTDERGDLIAFALLAPKAPEPGLTEPALDDIAARLASFR